MLMWIREDWQPHQSHDMGKFATTIRSPNGTPRFYSVSQCSKCGFEIGQCAAGRYAEEELAKLCTEVNEHD